MTRATCPSRSSLGTREENALRRTLAAMSDHDDTPAAGAAGAPEASQGWTDGDRRLLIITFAGGLAANVGLVIIIGAALAFVHYYKNAHHLGMLLWYSLAVVVVGPGIVLTSRYLYYKRGWWRDGGTPDPTIQRWALIFSFLALAEALLVLIGLADGVK
jgi:hypothetical protein